LKITLHKIKFISNYKSSSAPLLLHRDLLPDSHNCQLSTVNFQLIRILSIFTHSQAKNAMVNHLQLIIALILICLMFDACNKAKKPRTVFWSAFTYTYDFVNRDSITPLYFYLVNYIEVSDTGETKIMKRKQFKSPKEFYIIKIPDSVKSEILAFSSEDSCFLSKRYNPQEETRIYDGPTYFLQFKCDSIDKSVAFVPYSSYPLQRKLLNIFEDIRKSYQIIKETNLNLTNYEKKLDEKFRKNLPPPPRRDIKFTPPEIKPDD
jgi:hypothetical protein